MSDWNPTHFEDIDDGPTPRHEPETESALKSKDKPAEGMAIPMGMALMIPPDLIASIALLAGAQAGLLEGIEKLTAALVDGLSDMTEAIRASSEDSAGRTADSLAAVAEQMKGHAGMVQSLAEGQASLAQGVRDWTKTIETAMRAPREVRLERDQMGRAVGAVSEVKES